MVNQCVAHIYIYIHTHTFNRSTHIIGIKNKGVDYAQNTSHKHNKDLSRLRLLSPGIHVSTRYINSTRSTFFPQSSGAVLKPRWPSWAPVPNTPTVSVDVKQHSTNFIHVEAGQTSSCGPTTRGGGWVAGGTANFFQCLRCPLIGGLTQEYLNSSQT